MITERSILNAFALDRIQHYNPQTILDVGTGISALPRILDQCGYLVTAIDSYGEYWRRGLRNDYFPVQQDDITDTKLTDKRDLITCLHVLSHIEEWELALANMVKLLSPGGHILIGTPYNEHLGFPNAYAMPDAGYGHKAPYICRIFTMADFLKCGCRIIEHHYWRIFSGRLWTQGERLQPPQEVSKYETHQFATIVLEI